MFSSLRSRLIVAFALVISLSVVLGGMSFAILLQDYQTQLRLTQLADLSLPLSYQMEALGRAGTTSSEVEQSLSEQALAMQVRLLLVSEDGRIVVDTSGTLVGQKVTLPTAERGGPGRRAAWSTIRDVDGRRLYLLGGDAPRPSRPGERQPSRSVDSRIVVAAPEVGIVEGWRQLLPMISLAAGLSMLVSIGVAIVLARSIAGPITSITSAAERMARGQYDQQVSVTGRDEVGRLAESFNRMSREVARSHRTLKDFLLNVSHDLRTPLTSIQGFAQAMSDGTIQTPAEYSSAGRIIDEESSRMRRIVDELLDLSRLESGQVEMSRDPVDLAGLLDAGARRARRLAEENGAGLDLDLQPIPLVIGDGNRLEQAFDNLLDNAVKHTPAGHRITLRARYYPPSGGTGDGRVEVDVHNTGSYMAPDELPRVFERFYQADSSRKASGSGLGLAIVREIVLAHGGTVAAASDIDTGTTFTVTLPAGQAGATAPKSSRTQANRARKPVE